MLLASPQRHERHRSPAMFGNREPKASVEEYSAVTGVWRADIKLDDDEELSLSMHLAAPRSTTAFPSSGTVYVMKDNLPTDYCPTHFEPAWWSVNRHVPAGSQGDHILCLSLQLGHLFLKGRGQRDGLRCHTFVGVVEDADEDPCGEFTMRLSLPIKTDTSLLENRYRKRVEKRSPPLKDSAPYPPSLSEDEAKRSWLAHRDDPSWAESRSQQLQRRGQQGDFTCDDDDGTRDPGDDL